MVRVEDEAPADVQRYLSAIARSGDRSRRYAYGQWWERRHDGTWYTHVLVDEAPTAIRARDGSAPAMVVGQDVVEGYAKLERVRPSQSDIDSAYRGLQPTPVVQPDGTTRVDYADIPLKNADGSLTKYAKNMIDLHAPAREVEAELAHKVAASRQDA